MISFFLLKSSIANSLAYSKFSSSGVYENNSINFFNIISVLSVKVLKEKSTNILEV